MILTHRKKDTVGHTHTHNSTEHRVISQVLMQIGVCVYQVTQTWC